MFSVTPATNKKLTTLENLKTDLGITDNAQDEKLNRLIDRTSAMVAKYIGVPEAADGSATLAMETLVETFYESPWFRGCRRSLILARRPVVDVISVVAAGATIDLDDVEIDKNAGMIRRIGNIATPNYNTTPGSRTVVTYKAGWTLPGVADYTLPPDIEGAVIGLVRSARFAAARDPTIKAEWTTDVERLEYWVGQIGQNGAFPPDIASVLDPYCYEPVI
jgi:hypothetical protein